MNLRDELQNLLPGRAPKVLLAATIGLSVFLWSYIPSLPAAWLPASETERELLRWLALVSLWVLGLLAVVVVLVCQIRSKPDISAALSAARARVANARLEEIREKILSLLSATPKQNAKQVAKSLGVSESLAQYHLQELFSSGLITNLLTMGQPTVWLIDQNGRAYLVKNNLPI